MSGGLDYERMFHNAVAALAEISVTLGIPDDEAECANGNAEILEAIRALQARAQKVAAATLRAYGFLWHGAINTGVSEQGTLPVVSAAAEARRALCKVLSRDDQLRAIEDVRAEIWGTGEVRS